LCAAPTTVYEFAHSHDKQLNEVLNLNLRCFKAGENYTKYTFSYLLSEPNSISYCVVTPTGQMAAFVFVMTSREDGTGHITTIGVAPEHRRRGLANKLLHHAEEHCENATSALIMLEVRVVTAPAQNLTARRLFDCPAASELLQQWRRRFLMMNL
jgi:ribosomal protein S18 acetylase RimI-like enzyme